MSGILLFFLLGRVVLSVSANGAQKSLVNAGASVRLTWLITYALMVPPAICLAAINPGVGGATFFLNVLMGGLLDAAGNIAMLAALRVTDLSLFGPLNAFRPMLALLFGMVFLREVPTASGAAGVLITVAGAGLLLSDSSAPPVPQPRRQRKVIKLLFLRLSGIALSTLGAVFLKRAAMQGSAEVTLTGWIICGLLGLLLLPLLDDRRSVPPIRQELARHWPMLGVHSLMFLTMQWLTILVFQQSLLAYAFVFFQFAIILQVFTGWAIFHEQAFTQRRVLGCLLLLTGSALIVWKG